MKKLVKGMIKMEDNYNKALKEVYVILNYIDEEEKNKIPKEMLELIKENMDKEYNFKIDKNLKISEQKLLNETKGLISVLYSRYICSEEERKKWKEFDKFALYQKEELKKRKYKKNNSG